VREKRAVKRLLLALLLSSCSEWQATPEAGFRRVAAHRLQTCVANNLCQYVEQCFAESRAFCLDAGYPETCGYGEVEGSCGTGRK
jgi:hypothetical protein